MLKKKWLPSYKCCSCHWILKPFTSHWSSLTPVRTKNTLQIPNDFFYMLWLSGHYLERNKTFRNKNFKFCRSFLIYLQCNYYALHILKNKEKFNRWISVYSETYTGYRCIVHFPKHYQMKSMIMQTNNTEWESI